MSNLSKTIKATVTASRNGSYVFPEQTVNFLKASSNSAICFSGGGNRSLSACMGQMRGLHVLGILDNARYISCVSGGSWASAAYTYYKSGPKNDDELLGTDPTSATRKSRSLAEWSESLERVNLGFPTTTNFRKVLLHYIKSGKKDWAWLHAVRDVFFKPYGLDDNNFMADSAGSVKKIVQENAELQPGWDTSLFDIPRKDRPYLIINGTLLWPVGILDKVNRALLQFTPSYSGNPYALTLKEKHFFEKEEHLNTGGGVIDSFAFLSKGPNQAAATWQEMPAPSQAFSVWHASGISSTAYGYDVSSNIEELAGKYLIPQIEYWGVSDAETSQKVAKEQYVTDAGNLENLGIMAPLQRKVEYIVVFINSPDQIKKDDKGNIVVDTDVSALFGINNKGYTNNQVFPSSDYQQLLDDLWSSYQQGKLCMAKGRYTTQENNWFGIASYEVNVLWVYNAAVDNWAQLLDDNVRNDIAEGVKGKGPLAHFPNYKTMDENGLVTIHQTPEQTALIADMFSWGIQQQADDFKVFLTPVK